ncbi:MAG: STAS domain-containing protein [Clostridiales bacterium]|nr:STAS domain-containing protein [Clostridiales bacterium]
MRSNLTGDTLTLFFEGHVDSQNAPEIEQAVFAQVAEAKPTQVIIDAGRLAYISSAGLRVILKLKKTCPNTRAVNVSPEVYEVLEMTGFTDIIEVKKALRTLSVEGCEQIGRGGADRCGAAHKISI